MNENVFDLDHLPQTYLKLSLPVVMGLAVTLIYNLADTFFIARTGNTALVAGVSLCSPVFTTLMAFGNIFSQGGSSLISRLLGQNDEERIHHVSSFCFYGAMVTGVVLAVLMLLFQKPMLRMIGASADTMSYAKDYYCIMAVGAPIVILSFIHSGLVRCEGMAAQSMIGTVFGTVLNIVLDPILISGFGLGAAGAAIATVIGYLATDIFLFVLVMRKSRCLSVNPREWKISKGSLAQIMGVGVTAALTNLMQSMCVIVLNQFLLPYGSEKIAAMGIVLKANMIAQLIMVGFSFGGIPLFGYLYGAGNKQKIQELIQFCMKLLGGLAVVITALLFFAAPAIIRVFMNVDSIVAEGTVMLRWQVIGTTFAAVVLLMSVLFQATGKVLPAFLMSISRQGVVFVLALFVGTKILGYNGVLMSQAFADLLSAILAVVLYIRAFKRSKEKKAEVTS